MVTFKQIPKNPAKTLALQSPERNTPTTPTGHSKAPGSYKTAGPCGDETQGSSKISRSLKPCTQNPGVAFDPAND